ncbi:MAG: isochorismatase family protein [Fretibacterium sp.]|nr:isochorismatase family protein [Fretibacterium sp.]
MSKSLLVVDCQYDFIDGTLACEGSGEAVEKSVAYINAHPDVKVLYSSDWHGLKHCSFTENGGTWPVHCVAGTHGAALHEAFARDVLRPEQRPNDATVYHKGMDDGREEYSAFEARNAAGHTVAQDAGDDVLVCGIASEFCVRESVLALLDAGRRVTLLKDAVGWVDKAGHEKNLKDLEARRVTLSHA